jgi:hypothetical protein
MASWMREISSLCKVQVLRALVRECREALRVSASSDSFYLGMLFFKSASNISGESNVYILADITPKAML